MSAGALLIRIFIHASIRMVRNTLLYITMYYVILLNLIIKNKTANKFKSLGIVFHRVDVQVSSYSRNLWLPLSPTILMDE